MFVMLTGGHLLKEIKSLQLFIIFNIFSYYKDCAFLLKYMILRLITININSKKKILNYIEN